MKRGSSRWWRWGVWVGRARRIAREIGVRRETANVYLRAAGIAIRGPGRWGHPSKPAIEVSTDLVRGLPKPAIKVAVALIDDAIRWVTKHLRCGALEREARLVARRLEAVRDEIESLKSQALAIAE